MSELLFVGKNDSVILPAMRLLSLAGYTVGVQPSFRCALAEILLHPPDLIVLFSFVSSSDATNPIDRYSNSTGPDQVPSDSLEFLAVLHSYYRLRTISVVIVEDPAVPLRCKAEIDENGFYIRTGPVLTEIAEAVEYALTKPLELAPGPRSSLLASLGSRSPEY